MWRCELRTNGTRQPARHAAIPRGQRRSGRSWSGPRRGYRTSLKSDRARGLGLRPLVGVVACQPCGRHTVDERRPRPLSSPGMSTVDRVHERRKAAALARHYRDEEGFSIAEIARRLGRAPATIKAYLYDPTGDKARAVKRRYQGVCRGCGAPTAARGGKGDAYQYCKRCHPGAIAPVRTREWVRGAMREWRRRYGGPPSSTDWSRTHAVRRRGDAATRRRGDAATRRRAQTVA